jgi:uncharacterized protein YgbK (DUF1537 family)
MALVAILADDLTGAADSAAAFVSSGLTAAVLLDRTLSAPPADVLAYNLATRLRSASEAEAITERAVDLALAAGAGQLYRKVDSVLRGHVGPETAATLTALARRTGRRPFAIASTAFPATGRTVLGGRVHIDGSPGTAGDLAACLTEVGLRVRTIPLPVVRSGGRALGRVCRDAVEAGVDVLVPDTESDADLAAVAMAGATAAAGRPLVWVGSAGLAHHLPAALGLRAVGQPGPRAPWRTGRTLTVTGTRSPVAHAQHRRFGLATGAAAVVIPPDALLAGEQGPAMRPAHRALAAALAVGDAGLAVDPGRRVGPEDATELTAALGRFVAGHLSDVALLAMTGGETAQAVLAALGVAAVDVLAELEPGVVLVAAGHGPAPPMVTKAGGFGDQDTWVRCLAGDGRRFDHTA